MAKWRCLWGSIVFSRRLARCSLLANLLYRDGIAAADAWGIIRRDDVKAKLFPKRKLSDRQVESAVDELLAEGLLCQHGDGEVWLHWCNWDYYQGEKVRKGRGAPALVIQCPNAKRGKFRASPENSALARNTAPYIDIDKDIDIDNDNDNYGARARAKPPSPREEKPRSRLLEAVIARHPGAHAYYYDAFTALEREYGADFIWDCYRAALESGKTDPSARYLEGIARRCKAEGKLPLDKGDLKDEPNERPTEIDGRPVAGWLGDTPIFATPAKAP